MSTKPLDWSDKDVQLYVTKRYWFFSRFFRYTCVISDFPDQLSACPWKEKNIYPHLINFTNQTAVNKKGRGLWSCGKCSIIGLYMGPNNLCCVTPHSLLFFFCLMSVNFYKNFILSRHLLLYIYTLILYLYFITLSCRSSFSIKFQFECYNFYKILTSLSTVFIKAHVGFYNF